nr:hypothetical protein [Chryseolinea sp.]
EKEMPKIEASRKKINRLLTFITYVSGSKIVKGRVRIVVTQNFKLQTLTLNFAQLTLNFRPCQPS